MTTTLSPPIQEAPVDAGAGRVMRTPEIEPLVEPMQVSVRVVVSAGAIVSGTLLTVMSLGCEG